MTDKRSDSSATMQSPVGIDHGGVIEVIGGDAIAFVQAQCMNDVMALSDGAWQWSGWLTAKGRVTALFAVIRLEPERLWLWLPDFPADELARRLGRFVFRSKVKITWLGDIGAIGVFEPPLDRPSAPCRIARSPEHRVVLDLSGQGGSRWLCLSDRSNRVIAVPSDSNWRLLDLRHGFPRLAPDDVESYTAHMLSLQRLSAFSVRKGCYPGQEIVSRTHFLGHAKRGLVRVQGDDQLAAGDPLHADGEAVATVLNAVASPDGGFEALAVMPLSLDSGLTTAAGHPLVRLSLLDGLQRPGKD